MSEAIRRRGALAGAAIAIAYVVTALLTTHLSGRPTLPLFEGLSAPPPYQWMEPPPDFASGNVKPKPKTETVTIVGTGSGQDSISTDDGQFVLTLAPGAIPAKAGVSTAVITLTPLKPSGIGPLPHAYVPDGNAYGVTVKYGDGTALDAFVKPVSYLLRAPTTADAGVFARAGTGPWQTMQPVNTNQVNHYPFDSPIIGVFIAATREQVFSTGTTGGGSGSAVAAIVAGVLTVVVLGGVALLVYRRRNAATTTRPAARRPPRK